MRIKKIDKNAILPKRGSTFSAGYDLCTIDSGILQPGEWRLFKTGLAMEIPEGVYGRIAPRSGLAYKHAIDVLGGVIDSDYRGDVGVILINLGNSPFSVEVGDRIAQIIFEQHKSLNFTEAEELSEIDRGGGFGSTGKN